MWPDHKFINLAGLELPIIQAPMAGASGSEMAIAVAEAGGLGSLPCAMLDASKIDSELTLIRQATDKPVNINFFCHQPVQLDELQQVAWRKHLSKYYSELGVEAPVSQKSAALAPFDEAKCDILQKHKPEVVSFHFGLPEKSLLDRIKSLKCRVISTATTVKEARWLEDYGCDAIIAQGYEAGGHRGMFLTDDIASQTGMLALVPQIVDAVSVPVIAAGGVADGRAIAAAFALGASAVQVGTAYLFTPESLISPLHRQALLSAEKNESVITNVFSGRPARSLRNRLINEVGPISNVAPGFPTAGSALAPLKEKSEAAGRMDFSSLWAGQSARLGREMGAGHLTRQLAKEAIHRITLMASGRSIAYKV